MYASLLILLCWLLYFPYGDTIRVQNITRSSEPKVVVKTNLYHADQTGCYRVLFRVFFFAMMMSALLTLSRFLEHHWAGMGW